MQYVHLTEEAKQILRSLIPGNTSVWVFPSDNPETHLDADNFYGRIYMPALVKAVEDVRDGRVDLSLSETLQVARPFVARVGIASILAGIAIGIGLVLLIVPGLFLITIWCLVVPVIVLEGVGSLQSFGRSRDLVRGFGWNVFGTLAAVFVLLILADIVIGLILSPLGEPARQILSSLVSGTVVAPFLALVVTLGYFRLRDAHQTYPS